MPRAWAGREDLAQIEFARQEVRAIVAHDRDFPRHHAEGVAHAGILYSYQDKYSVGELLSLLVVAHGVLSAEDTIGVLEFLWFGCLTGANAIAELNTHR